MPNHVTTILEIKDSTGTSDQEIRSTLVNNEGMIDFNLIIPEWLALDKGLI